MKSTITVNGKTRLGELVTYFPTITTRLNELHIDYCCQGDRTIEEAIEEANLNSGFIAEIQNAYSDYLAKPNKELSVAELSDEQLIDLILKLNTNVQIILTTHSPAVIMNGWMDKVTEVSDITDQ